MRLKVGVHRSINLRGIIWKSALLWFIQCGCLRSVCLYLLSLPWSAGKSDDDDDAEDDDGPSKLMLQSPPHVDHRRARASADSPLESVEFADIARAGSEEDAQHTNRDGDGDDYIAATPVGPRKRKVLGVHLADSVPKSDEKSSKVAPNSDARSSKDGHSDALSSISRSSVSLFHKTLESGKMVEEQILVLLRALLIVVTLFILGMSLATMVVSKGDIAKAIEHVHLTGLEGTRQIKQQVRCLKRSGCVLGRD